MLNTTHRQFVASVEQGAVIAWRTRTIPQFFRLVWTVDSAAAGLV
ncbi:hypothetical protein ACVBEG_27370 [Pseudomonas sp. GG8]